MSNFENYDFILHDGVVIENEKADKEGRKKRMSAMCVKVREQTNMNRKEFAEWLGIPYRTMQDWERGVSEVPDYVLNLIAYKVKNEKEKVVIPFALCTDKCKVKFLIQNRNRYIKRINLLSCAIAIIDSLYSWLQKLSLVLFLIY